MRTVAYVVVATMIVMLLTGCAPVGTSTGDGDGLHTIVPDVTGMSLPEAESVLEGAGYVVGDVSGAATASDGMVVKQSPIPSTSLPRGAEVDLVLEAAE